MYFYNERYHEAYHDGHYTEAALEVLRCRDRCDDDPTYEPIGTPSILNWLFVASVAVCVIFTAINGLS